MMNLKEEDANLGCTKFSIHTKLLRTSGAGVNADSRVNLAFPTSDPLSELVWSPCNGLSLKCATSAAADNKPFRLWNVGLNLSGDQANFTTPQTLLHADDMIIDKPALLTSSESRPPPDLGPIHPYCDGLENDRIMEEGADKKDAIREESCMVDWKANACHPQNVQTDGIAETSTIIAGIHESEVAILPETPLKKLESCAENELCGLTENGEVPRENGVPGEGSPTGSRICFYQETGKGKALSDGDIYGRSSDGEDESHESCNSGGLSSKGIKGEKRQIYDRGVILGSKRLKMQIHGSHGSTSVTKPDSSFMNWILNMTKGVSDCNKEDSPSPSPLTLACFRQQDSASISMGFQTIFQSLYCKEADAMNAGRKKIAESIEESREHAVDDKTSPENLPGSYDRNCGNSSEKSGLCNKEVDPTHSANVENSLANKASEELVYSAAKEEMKMTAKEAYPYIPSATSDDVLVKDNPRKSLWITRLSTKTPRSVKGKEIAEADLDSPTEQNSSESRGEFAEFNASIKGNQNIIKSEASFEFKSILPSQRFSSETMASVFARRLETLRHITSSKTGKSSTFSHICFFCGGCHDVHECPNVTKSELQDLLLKLSTLKAVEESSCRCIRCSGSDHWAASCPLAPCSSRKPLFGYFPAYQTCKFDIESSETRRHNSLKSTKDVQNTVAKSQIFVALRKLRLSRTDIVRWMNSNVPLYRLNGFFLRLRLGKPETGLEGSSYYVASLTGDARENDGNKWMLVDVGGIKSYVSSQYVSNHDFLEDEMEAWWCTSVDSGCRVPSLAELNSKFNYRKTLGAELINSNLDDQET